MGHWVDAYIGREGKLLRPGFVMLAVLFDRARVTPGLTVPLEAVYTDRCADDIDVQKFVHDVVPDSTYGRALDDGKVTDNVVVIGGGGEVDPMWMDAGNRVFVIAWDAGRVQPEAVRRSLHRTSRLVLDAEAIIDFVHAWYAGADPGFIEAVETRLRETRFVANPTVDIVVLAAKRGTNPLYFLSALLDIVFVEGGTDQHHDHDDPPRDDDDVVDIGAAADSVVRKLSQMTGFGPAADWGMQLAADLRDYHAGELAWRDVDKGVLLVSPPGGGKTTFARALAQECDAHFVSVTYGAFETGGGSYVVKGMRKAFDEWRKLARDKPVLVFFDEIDSMGARGDNGHNDSYWAAIINCLLDFLDGAEPRTGIVMVGATNHPGRVDPALRRAGRLDRIVEIPVPDLPALAGIVAAHLGVPVDHPNTLLGARAVRGRTPSQVEQLCRDTRRMGRMLKRKVDGFDLADVVRFTRTDRSPHAERVVAVHEAGHAVAVLHFGIDKLLAMDVDGNGVDTGGSVSHESSSGLHTVADVESRVVVMLAGRAAEDVVIGAVTLGAEADLKKCTMHLSYLRYRWGMRERLFTSNNPDIALTPDQQAEIEAELQAAYAKARAIVLAERHVIAHLAEALTRERFLDGSEVKKLIADYHSDGFFARAVNDDYPDGPEVDMVNDRIPRRRVCA